MKIIADINTLLFCELRFVDDGNILFFQLQQYFSIRFLKFLLLTQHCLLDFLQKLIGISAYQVFAFLSPLGHSPNGRHPYSEKFIAVTGENSQKS